jgi:hypothetical protein
MSVWALATDVAIWTLIAGSLAVFGWFLAEVTRLVRAEQRPADEERDEERQDPGP